MKKIAKVVIGVTMAATVAATAGVIAGCSSSKTGEAYGLTHGAGYVGYSKIVVNGDKVNDLILIEVCLPTHVTADETVADGDKVNGTYSNHGAVATADFYKTLTIGSTVFTYDVTLSGDYSIGYKTAEGTTLLSWLSSEANCKAYYDAVTTNTLKVKIGTEEKTDVLNNANLSKEENGYWGRTDKDGNSYSRWKMNRDATVNYVKTYGVANLTSLAKASKTVPDTKEDKDVTYWMDGEISTGATWNDLNSTSDSYLSYAQLIINANEAAK
ncbi:MAG: hypothetical protein ACI4VK_03580 [Candidatus Coproplasma sp.]